MAEEKQPKEGDLRVWHTCAFGQNLSFYQPVSNIAEAVFALNLIANYDFYVHEKIYDNPDFCNAQGLQVYERGEWVDWEDEMGESINTYTRGDKQVPVAGTV